MAKDTNNINVIFGGMIGLLGGFVLAYLYFQQAHPPVIQPPAAAGMPQDPGKLPENHPPIDSARELLVLEQLSRAAPQNAEYKTRIGNIYYDTGQYQKAITAYEQSLALNPQNPGVETDMATCFHYLGQHDKSLEILQKVLRYSPGFGQALFNQGVVLQAGKKDAAGALAAWEELLRVQPNFPQRADLERRMRELRSTSK